MTERDPLKKPSFLCILHCTLALNKACMQIGWAVSAALRTEKLYDALGSSAFAACAIGTLTYAKYYHARQIVATIFVMVWAARLGGFLFFRVLKTGSDSRFDEVKSQPCESFSHSFPDALQPATPCNAVHRMTTNHLSGAVKYLIYWTVQAVWVWVTLLPVIILNGSEHNPGMLAFVRKCAPEML